MVVWFRHGSCTVGVEDGVVRAGDFAALTSLLQAANTLEGERDRLLADAHAQAQQVVAQAQKYAQHVANEAQAEAERLTAQATQQAQTLIADARKTHAEAYNEGLGQGEREAIAQWTQRAVTHAQSSRLGLERQRERLSGIVSLAVERMVEQEDKQALYMRALRTVTKMVKNVPLLTLRVNFQDKVAAQKALSAVSDQLHSDMPIEVVGDSALAGGSCMFESDQGVIDVGLETQLAAIKRAVSRAALSTDSLGAMTDEMARDATMPEPENTTTSKSVVAAAEQALEAKAFVADEATAQSDEEAQYKATAAAQDDDDFLDDDLFDDDDDFSDDDDETDEFADDDEFADELLLEDEDAALMPQTAVRLSNPNAA
jgi:type III secretion protein L